MIRDNEKRALMFDLDNAIQEVSGDRPDHPAAVKLTGVHHNLLRGCAEV